MVKGIADNGEPFISVVTPCFNSEEYLDSAIQSVLRQDYNNFEHILIDGGSTDNTLGIAGSYSHITLISEIGSGIYDAVNIGIKAAKGELIGWLNSDDEYAHEFFYKACEEFKKNPHIDVLYGDGVVFKEGQENGRCVIRRHTLGNEDDLNKQDLKGSNAFLNCALFNSEVYNRIGYFDTKYTISSDKDWFLRLFVGRPTVKKVTDVSYLARSHGGSLTFSKDQDPKNMEIVAVSGMEIGNKYLESALTPENIRVYCKNLVRKRSRELIELQIRKGKFLCAIEIAVSQMVKDPSVVVLIAKKLAQKTNGLSRMLLVRKKK